MSNTPTPFPAFKSTGPLQAWMYYARKRTRALRIAATAAQFQAQPTNTDLVATSPPSDAAELASPTK